MLLFNRFKILHVFLLFLSVFFILGIIKYNAEINGDFAHDARKALGPDQAEITNTLSKKHLCQDGQFERKAIYHPTFGYIVENEFLTIGPPNEEKTKGMNQTQIDELQHQITQYIKNIPAVPVRGNCGAYWKITRTTTPKEFKDIINKLRDTGAVLIPDTIAFPN